MTLSWHKNITIQKRAAFISLLFFFLGLFIFGFASRVTNSHIKDLSRERFLKETDELKKNLQYRIDAGITILYQVKGFFESSMLVEPHEWKKYVEITEVLKRNPNLTALSYIERVSKENKEVFLSDIRKTFPDYKIFPESDKGEYFVIKYIETRNQSKVLGFDVASDPNRSKSIVKAQATGMAATTDVIPVPLSIETNIVSPIFSIYVPIYNGESGIFQGIISMAFALQDFFPGAFSKDIPQDLEIKITNGTTIFDHKSDPKGDKILTVPGKIIVADKEWGIDFSTAEGFGLGRVTQMLPMLILLFGPLFSITFALAVYFLVASREHAIILAKGITAQIEAVLASIGEGLFATDKNGNIILVNREFENMIGWKAAEIYGKKFSQVLPMLDEDKKPVSENARHIVKIMRDGKKSTTTTTTTYYQRRDGTILPVAVNASPITIEGELIGAVEVFRDITKEKEIEKAKNEFISIASHQLRTPVSGLSWLTEALQFTSENLTPKQKTYVNDLAMFSKRLIMLVEDLLNVSRIQLKTPLVTEKSLVDIAGFVEEFIKEIEHYSSSKKHIIIFNKSITGPLTIEINKKSLYNVLQNLVSNSIEYSPENTAVTINLEKDGSFIKISISNKGPAIPKEDQLRIFERFYRSEDAKKIKPEGTGLGLYIIKTIVEDMGGKVGFESKEGKDTTFWFTIPLKTVIINK